MELHKNSRTEICNNFNQIHERGSTAEKRQKKKLVNLKTKQLKKIV
jgi:hypothetical protein